MRKESEGKKGRQRMRCIVAERTVQNHRPNLEFQITDNIMNVRESLLLELTIRENLRQGLSSDSDRAASERLKRSMEIARCEIVEVLRGLF
jgi:hypothetical protein